MSPKDCLMAAAALENYPTTEWLLYRHFIKLSSRFYVPLKSACARFARVELSEFHTDQARAHTTHLGLRVVHLLPLKISTLIACRRVH